MSVSMRDIGWIAGLIEGEGCIVTTKGTLRLSIEMTDLDVLCKARDILGPQCRLSKRVVKLKNPKHRDRYILHLSGSRMAQWLMTIYPLMGSRRQAKIEDALKMFKARRNKPRNKISKHPLPLFGIPLGSSSIHNGVH